MSAPLPRRNPLPQLTPARVRRLQECIQELLWSRKEELSVLISEEQLEPLTWRQTGSLTLTPLAPGKFFGRGGDNWTSFWMKTEIPQARPGEEGCRFLLWRCQGETTVWIDGQAWAGLDIGHQHCPLPDGSCTVWLECCSWQTGIWISMIDNEPIGPHGLRFDGAELAVRDVTSWQCSCDLDALIQVLEQALRADEDLKLAPRMGYCRAIESASPRLRMLLHEMDQLCDQWQLTGDVTSLGRACRDFLDRWPAEAWQPTAAVCGHAHIDLVWLWPESATRKKIVHTFATVLRLMEDYPELQFVQSMPALYRMLQEDCPEMMTRIVDHIESGRWEVLGGFEVEPDTNLPGGEALIRSLLMGQKKIEQLTGKPSEVAWIPDVFGYNQCLPQILALGGIKYFYTTKMTWSNVTKFPYTSFVWRGPDGSEVVAHLGTTDYNGEVLLEAHEKAIGEHRQAGVHRELLLPTGYGDGGGGPTDLHVERVRRFENLSGAPVARWTRVDEFFARLEQIKDQLPRYQGELYLEYHRGTYTTQSELKRLYRRAEQALQAHEAAQVATGGVPLPESHWQRLAFAHFHDALPGSSIREVYADLCPELAEIGDRQFSHARDTLSGSGGAESTGNRPTLAFNSLPYARLATVEHAGQAVQVRLPAVGSANIDPASPIDGPLLQVDAKTLQHARLAAHFSSHGQLAGLEIDGQALELSGAPGFVLSPDDPAAFDAWDIDHHAAQLGDRVAEQLQLRVVENTPARGVLESDPAPVGAASEIRLRYILEAGSTHLKIEVLVDWHESHKLLRYVVATQYLGRHALFGCPFGAIQRPQLAGDEADEAMWEVPASRWAAVQHDGGAEGLALCADSKLGYAARDGVLSLSLLRAPKWPDPQADMGTHVIPFALGALKLDATDEYLSTSMAADALFSPPLLYAGAPMPALLQWERLGSLNPSWCAPCHSGGDAFFLRLHESSGHSGVARLLPASSFVRVELIDWHENPLRELPLDDHGRVEVAYRPWQILTLRVVRAN